MYLEELDTSDFSSGDWLHAAGDHREALLYSLLYTPNILRLEECIFFEPFVGDVDRLRNQMDESLTARRRCRLEWSWNVIEVPYVFNTVDLATDEEQHLQILCDRLIDAWSAWLSNKVDGKQIEFVLYEDDFEIRFWVDRGCEMDYV